MNIGEKEQQFRQYQEAQDRLEQETKQKAIDSLNSAMAEYKLLEEDPKYHNFIGSLKMRLEVLRYQRDRLLGNIKSSEQYAREGLILDSRINELSKILNQKSDFEERLKILTSPQEDTAIPKA